MHVDTRSIKRQTLAQVEIICDNYATQLTNRNARPLGGVDKVRSRNSWAGRLESDGFATFSGTREAGSKDPARETEWSREGYAIIREAHFGGCQERFNKWFANFTRYLRRTPTPAEVRAKLSEGQKKRKVPQKGTKVKGGVWKA